MNAQERLLPQRAATATPEDNRMTPSANLPRRSTGGARKTRATSAPDSSTSNQRLPGAEAAATPKSGASSGETPIDSDHRSAACGTPVPPASAEPVTGSRGT
jgi:hypothetical protein